MADAQQKFSSGIVLKTLLQLSVTVVLMIWIFHLVDLHAIIQTIAAMNLTFLWLSLPLYFINIQSRIQRWLIATSKFDIQLNVSTALKSYFAGMTGAAVTPGRVGEYIRIFFVNDRRRPSLAAAMTIERLSGGGPLMLISCISLLIADRSYPWIIIATGILGSLQVIILHWKVNWLVGIVHWLPIKWQEKVNNSHWIEYLLKLSPGDVFEITLQSIIQYISFLVLFTLTVIGLTHAPFFKVFVALTVVFTIKTFFAFSLGELGVREAAAVYFLGSLGITNEVAVAASLIMWLYDVMIPAFAGLPFIGQFRWKAAPLREKVVMLSSKGDKNA